MKLYTTYYDKIDESDFIQSTIAKNMLVGTINDKVILAFPWRKGEHSIIELDDTDVYDKFEFVRHLTSVIFDVAVSPDNPPEGDFVPLAIHLLDSDVAGKVDCEFLPGSCLAFYSSLCLCAVIKSGTMASIAITGSSSRLLPAVFTLKNKNNRLSQFIDVPSYQSLVHRLDYLGTADRPVHLTAH